MLKGSPEGIRAKRVLWFVLGFGLALLLVVIAWRPFRDAIAGKPTAPPTARPTATPIAITSAPTPTPSPQVEPSPTPQAFSLSWQREGPIMGLCDHLTVGEKNRAYYWRCNEGAHFGRLTPNELSTYLSYVIRYSSFAYMAQHNLGKLDSFTVRLRFSGRGSYVPTDAEQAEVANWATTVYERLTRAEQEERIVALTRFHLAGRLRLSADSIRTVSVEAVTWPDTCLGIPFEGASCVPLLTPGLRVLLEVGGVTYEYHTDLLSQVRPLEVAQPTATPTPTPTPTPWPTVTPMPTSYPVIITDWLGEYYANSTLSGTAALVRNDTWVNFDWGYGAPSQNLPADYFSARWSRRMRFAEGQYRFKVRADDGVRLWVAGNLLLDRWHSGYTEDNVSQYVMTGQHEIVVEYFEIEGLAEIDVSWQRIQPKPTRTATPTREPEITDWRGAYYNNENLEGDPVLVRNDEQIAFIWGSERPASGVRKDGFSVRWTRRFYFGEGPYRFYARIDDGVRLWVDSELVIDEWREGGLTNFLGHIWLDSGEHDVRVEYFENSGEAEVHVWWERLETFTHWQGVYYRNRQLEGDPAFIRDDEKLAFDWGNGSPGARMPTNDFSIRWTRDVALAGGRYRFEAYADDGVRLYVDGSLLIDEWIDSPGHIHRQDINLADGTYTLIVEYYEHRGSARVGLGWHRISSGPPRE